MEFGIFIQGYTPQFRRDVDPDAEHHAFMDELELVQAADQAGFKYVWVTEHHFLDEYSHLSANDVVLGLPGPCHRAHPPGVGHLQPAAAGEPPGQGGRAGRHARPPLRRPLRVRHRPGRGQPRDPRLLARDGSRIFGVTKEIWEDVIGEFAKMWLQDDYEGYEGKYWSLPPRKVLPKPWRQAPPGHVVRGGQHVELCDGGPQGSGRARLLGRIHRRARTGDGGLQEGRSPTPNPWARSSTTTSWSPRPRSSPRTRRRRQVAARLAMDVPAEQRVPLPRHLPAPRLGAAVAGADPRRHPEADAVPPGVRAQSSATPTRRSSSASAGRRPAPTSSSSASGSAPAGQSLETIRLMGEHVIPKIDTDPVHRTTRMREAAAAKLPD